MLDFGFDKLALIGAVALIVIGPEKLPRVARTVGHFVGKAQRYVAEVKAEVNRSIELEELQKMKQQFETAASDVQQSISSEVSSVSSSVSDAWHGGESTAAHAPNYDDDPYHRSLYPQHEPVKKNWRVKRSAMPHWYKQRAGVRRHAQSGAARVARFRPRPLGRGGSGAAGGGA